MKKIVIVVAGVLLVSSMALAEDSPDRSHVRLVPTLPAQCLETGSAVKNSVKYTCSKVDTSEVWNEVELRKFDKDIFDAYQEPLPVNPERTHIGLVVRQDTVETTTHMQPQITSTEKKEVAVVERRDGYKYRYARR